MDAGDEDLGLSLAGESGGRVSTHTGSIAGRECLDNYEERCNHTCWPMFLEETLDENRA